MLQHMQSLVCSACVCAARGLNRQSGAHSETVCSYF